MRYSHIIPERLVPIVRVRISMSFVTTMPAALAAAATDLAGVGSAIGSANATAASPTAGILAAAEDEVSAAISALFSGYAQAYQRLSAQAARFHEDFVQTLTAGGRWYAAVEAAQRPSLQGAAGASPLQAVAAGLWSRCPTRSMRVPWRCWGVH